MRRESWAKRKPMRSLAGRDSWTRASGRLSRFGALVSGHKIRSLPDRVKEPPRLLSHEGLKSRKSPHLLRFCNLDSGERFPSVAWAQSNEIPTALAKRSNSSGGYRSFHAFRAAS